MDHGLYLIGTFLGVKPVTKKDGSAVNGMYKLGVDVAPAHVEREFARDAVFFDQDRETGEPTKVAQQLDALALPVGSPVAVRVTASTSDGSKWVNYNAVSVEALTEPAKK